MSYTLTQKGRVLRVYAQPETAIGALLKLAKFQGALQCVKVHYYRGAGLHPVLPAALFLLEQASEALTARATQGHVELK